MNFITYPMGQFLNFIYNTLAFHKYGLAIIIFTVFIRLILLPLNIKQYRSMAKTQEIQPQLQELQRKYKNDKEKLNAEMMKLYQENKVNPAGGCLPLLIQMPILFSLYYVISQPLKYMMNKTPEVINQLYQKVPQGIDKLANLKDISILNHFNRHPEQLSSVENLLHKQDLINLDFFGILNLGMIPSLDPGKIFGATTWMHYLPLIFVPILAAVTTFISIKYSTASSANKTSDNAMANQMNSSMVMIMPLMTAFFAFSVPAGLGLYWIVGNIIQIFQQMFMNKYIIKKKVGADK